MARKVLVVEDDARLTALLETTLRRAGYAVVSASDGESGIGIFGKARPDLVILDVGLPKMDGIEVCKAIRAESPVPILMLSGRGEEVDRVLGLEIGADDYVTKPFSVRELVARVKALLRRPAAGRAPAAVITAGALEISTDTYEARVKGVPAGLTAKEFDLLKALASDPGRVHSRDDLLERVWGSRHAAELDTRTVDQHVARLRRKLGPEGSRVVTVKNRGYRFKA